MNGKYLRRLALFATLSMAALVPGCTRTDPGGAAKAIAACITSCEAVRDTCNKGCEKPGDPDEIRGCHRACGQDHNTCRSACAERARQESPAPPNPAK